MAESYDSVWQDAPLYTATSMQGTIFDDPNALNEQKSTDQIESAVKRVIDREFVKVDYNFHFSVLLTLSLTNSFMLICIILFK